MAGLTSGSVLKAAGLLEQMRLHMETDAGKELTKKIGLVYQLNIAPKVDETGVPVVYLPLLGRLDVYLSFHADPPRFPF